MSPRLSLSGDHRYGSHLGADHHEGDGNDDDHDDDGDGGPGVEQDGGLA